MDMAGDREVCQTIELDHDSVDGSRSPFKSVNSKLGLAPLCSPAAVLRWYVLLVPEQSKAGGQSRGGFLRNSGKSGGMRGVTRRNRVHGWQLEGRQAPPIVRPSWETSSSYFRPTTTTVNRTTTTNVAKHTEHTESRPGRESGKNC